MDAYDVLYSACRCACHVRPACDFCGADVYATQLDEADIPPGHPYPWHWKHVGGLWSCWDAAEVRHYATVNGSESAS